MHRGPAPWRAPGPMMTMWPKNVASMANRHNELTQITKWDADTKFMMLDCFRDASGAIREPLCQEEKVIFWINFLKRYSLEKKCAIFNMMRVTEFVREKIGASPRCLDGVIAAWLK